MLFQRRESDKIYEKKRCCVRECPKISPYEEFKRSFHSFPPKKKIFVTITSRLGLQQRVDCFDEWRRCLKIQNPKKHELVCSLHFTENDYNLPDYTAGKRLLKKGAVPSQHLPTPITHKDTGKLTARGKRAIQRAALSIFATRNHKRKCKETVKKVIDPLDEHANKVLYDMLDGLHESCVPVIANDQNIVHVDKEIPAESNDIIQNLLSPDKDDTQETLIESDFKSDSNTRDVGVQVQTDVGLFSISSLITDDHKLWNLCGIKNAKILDRLVLLMEKFFPDKRVHKLSVKDRIILTCMKLKLDLRFSTLSIFFSTISENHCRIVFLDVLVKLSAILKIAIRWPTKEEIMNNMPHCFQGFVNTVVVLDCIEFKVERPRCLNCRIKLFSQYKSNFTVKFMTGVSPGGLLTFVSRAYGGRVSDKVIFEQSNIVNLIDRGDAVMVDRGFLIDLLCEKNGIKMYRPAYKKDKGQLSEEDAKKSRKIATARVHVERMNQRIRDFDILNNRIGSGLIKYVEEIMYVCCGLANLGSPILGDDKFM